jgi:NAD(P) transhydrogenase subunit alpha
VENLFKNKTLEFDMTDEIVKDSLVTHQGELLHQGTRKAMGLSN